MAESNPNARLEAFCDGVFAIALTFLIIDVRLPSRENSLLAMAAVWFPLTAAIVTTMTWIFWLALSISLDHI